MGLAENTRVGLRGHTEGSRRTWGDPPHESSGLRCSAVCLLSFM